MALNSVMKHNFSNVPPPKLQRSVFNRSHGHKLTFDASWLVPVYVDEVLPGDTFTMNATFFSRLNTPIVPFMDNIFLDTFWFFVPNRLCWAGWEDMISGADAYYPDISGGTPRPFPTGTLVMDPDIAAQDPTDADGNIVNSGSNYIRFYNYMGVPFCKQPQSIQLGPSMAYIAIWKDWFMDQNLQNGMSLRDPVSQLPADFDSDTFWDTSSPTLNNGGGLLPRGKAHDYFTSCLPWPQKGPGVEISIGSNAFAPIVVNPAHVGLGIGATTFADSEYIVQPTDAGKIALGSGAPHGTVTWDANSTDMTLTLNSGLTGGETLNIANMGLWAADIGQAAISPITINELREAFQLQKMLEKDARGGTRYTEQLRAHFGVISPDARLQRAEFLGSSSQRMYVTPVQQTSATDSTSPQGNLAAYGATSFRSGFHKSFVEHGFIFGLINARADITYGQGRNKMWDRRTRYDYYWPSLAHLGEQAVLNSEIYVTGTDIDKDVFGYQERWAEYRYKPSLVSGHFNPEWPAGLPQWTLCEDFASTPSLNNVFIRDSSRRRIDRVIAVPSQPQVLMDCYFDLKCAREMPVYSVPGLIDHF